jgi:RNA polymerase sigma-70 factor, ECF subfamily
MRIMRLIHGTAQKRPRIEHLDAKVEQLAANQARCCGFWQFCDGGAERETPRRACIFCAAQRNLRPPSDGRFLPRLGAAPAAPFLRRRQRGLPSHEERAQSRQPERGDQRDVRSDEIAEAHRVYRGSSGPDLSPYGQLFRVRTALATSAKDREPRKTVISTSPPGGNNATRSSEGTGAAVRQRELAWAEWMRAANAGNAAAYDRLLRDMAAALRPIVRRGLARAGRAVADAEDVVQEILLAVHLKRHTWDPARPIGPWIRAVARHKLVDALRRRGSRYDASIDEFSETLAAEDAQPGVSGRDVERQLAELPAGQRLVVRTIAIDGASIAEAAARLKMTQGAVRVAFHRGLAALARKA